MTKRNHDFQNPDFRGIQEALARGAVRGPYFASETGLSLAEIATELIGSSWLKVHDAEVARAAAEKAWDEGHNHCYHVENPNQSSDNPHRAKGITE